MVATRIRELLIGIGLPHVIASLEAIAHRFSPDQQERICAQLFEIEAEVERPHTVH